MMRLAAPPITVRLWPPRHLRSRRHVLGPFPPAHLDLVEPSVNVWIEVHDARTGALLDRQRGHNLVTTSGRNLLRDLLQGAAAAGPITTFALGTDSTPAQNSDTALRAQVLSDAITLLTPSDGQLLAQYYLNPSTLNGTTIAEAGLLTAASTLYARYVLDTPIAKDSSKAVVFSWVNAWTASGMVTNIQVGDIVDFGGSATTYVRPASANAYPSGSTLDKIVPGSGVW